MRLFVSKGYNMSSAKTADEIIEQPKLPNIADKPNTNKNGLHYKEITINFSQMTVAELKKYCKNNNIKGYSKLRKDQLIEIINTHITNNQQTNTLIKNAHKIVKPIKQNFKDIRIVRQNNNNKIVYESLIKGYFDVKHINVKEYKRTLFDLEITETEFLTKCKEDHLFAKLTARHISKKTPTQDNEINEKPNMIKEKINDISIQKDGFTKQLLKDSINKYNDLYSFIDNVNSKLTIKKFRKPNYPSEITENLVKFAITKKYNTSPTEKLLPSWDTKKGDLCLRDMQIEVKGSVDLMNGGPCSFGPKEEWDYIYFVDALNRSRNEFKIYEIKLSNEDKIWKNIKVNKNETYQNQCLQKRRPRITFKELIRQIPESYINILFDGNINDL